MYNPHTIQYNLNTERSKEPIFFTYAVQTLEYYI